MYTDVYGNVWTSRQGSVYPQDVEFIDIFQDSDETGDYSLFTCNYNCYVYRDYLDTLGNPVTDEISLTNCVLKGWFRR